MKAKSISKILTLFLLSALTFTMLFSTCSFAGNKSDTDITYDSLLFDQSYVHTIDIQISDEDLSDLLANPTDKTKYKVNVTVDGEQFNDVSFSTKGNTSLSSVATSGSDRYSFKINFGKYVDGQTYHGLKKLNLSNMYADATYMKDYISYEIFRAVGVEAPLTSYVMISINGEAHGLYLAIEDVSGSYLDRTTDGEGELYKPSNGIDNINEGPGEDFEMPDNADENFPGISGSDNAGDAETDTDTDAPRVQEAAEDAPAVNAETPADAETTDDAAGGSSPDSAALEQEAAEEAPAADTETAAAADTSADTATAPDTADVQAAPGASDTQAADGETAADFADFATDFADFGFGGGFGNNSSGGADLAYIDDELSSYSGIFDNAETNVDEKDEEKVVKALKNLSEGNAEDALDTDEVIRYFAAHNFVMNYDSYTGTMLHNYYLLEKDGKLSIIPWDYNLAFGTFGAVGSSDSFDFDFDSSDFADLTDTAAAGVSDTQAAADNESAETVPDAADMPAAAGASDIQAADTETAEPAPDAAPDTDAAPAVSAQDATYMVNYGIDSPLSGSTEDSRPMWSWIVNDEEYLEQYHDVLNELITNYFDSGEFEAEMDRVYNMISSYVESDPTAFYTMDEFEKAYDSLRQFCLLRAESIRKQLNGELSTVTSEQTDEDKVDASMISVSDTGSMSMGFGMNMDFSDKFSGFPGGSGASAAEGQEAAEAAPADNSAETAAESENTADDTENTDTAAEPAAAE